MFGLADLAHPRLLRERRVRHRLARRYLTGDGIEVGALHLPLALPAGARVRYVDRYDVAGLRAHYPELAELDLVDPDIVDDGETLATIPDASLDFVVANHFIEHTQDPIATIAAQLRVLRPGGRIFMAVPEGSRSIDSARPLTSLEHVLQDHAEGPAGSRMDHYREWAELVDRADDPSSHAAALADLGYSIHFHVWTMATFGELLEHAHGALGLPLEVTRLQANGPEFICVLTKRR